MTFNEHLIEGGALADVVQAQLLIAVVYMARDPDRLLDHARRLGALRRRVSALLERGPEAAYDRRRTARSRL